MKRIWVPILALALLLPGVVYAGGVDLSDAPVIRKPLEWRKGRFGLTPVIGMTVNDPYWTSMLVGASADYHILDWLAVGVDFRFAVGFTSGLLDEIESDLAGARGVSESAGEVDFVTTSRVHYLATANVQFIPLYGKFVMFDAVEMAYDLHLLLGVGYARTIAFPEDSGARQIDESDGSVAPVAGVGLRLFINRWFGINFEFRDYLVNMVRVVPEYSTSEGTPGKSFEHNFALSLGFTFLLPTEIGNAAD